MREFIWSITVIARLSLARLQAIREGGVQTLRSLFAGLARGSGGYRLLRSDQ